MSHKTFGFVLGPILFITVLSLPPFESFHATAQRLVTDGQLSLDPGEIVYSMKVVFALLALMVVWWLTEAIPLPATALLPAVVLPWFHIVGRERTVMNKIGPKTKHSVLF